MAVRVTGIGIEDLAAQAALERQVEEKRRLLARKAARAWRWSARPEQLPPPVWSRVIYLQGGRGSGKTWTGTNLLAELILTSEPGEWAIVAPTFGDCRDIYMEGQESGLIKALGGRVGTGGTLHEVGPHIEAWNRSTGQLRLKNGSVVFSDGGDDGAYRIQGHNLRGCLCGEIGLWQKWKAAWDESIRYAVRLSPAKIVAEGTPKATMAARALVRRLIDDPAVVVRRLRTEDNRANLDPGALAAFLSSKGTSLERQELTGTLIENVEGALWQTQVIDAHRLAAPTSSPGDPFGIFALFERIEPVRVCIGVDPAVTFSDDSDDHGIVAVAKGKDAHHYVLEDLSRRAPVTAWPRVVMEAAERWQVDRVVGEVNNGGDYIEATMRAAGFQGSFETVRATRGKQLRAEPLAAYYHKGLVHHVGTFPDLEAQMTGWVPGETDDSPDRLDALVWACTWLEPRLAGGWERLYLPVDPDQEPEHRGPHRIGWGDVYKSAAQLEQERITRERGEEAAAVARLMAAGAAQQLGTRTGPGRPLQHVPLSPPPGDVPRGDPVPDGEQTGPAPGGTTECEACGRPGPELRRCSCGCDRVQCRPCRIRHGEPEPRSPAATTPQPIAWGQGRTGTWFRRVSP